MEIRQAMEKQMKADREKRASILLAEGEKQAAITRAEGEKESAILRAEAVKQQRIREAEAKPKPSDRPEGTGRCHSHDQRGEPQPQLSGPAQHGGHGEGR